MNPTDIDTTSQTEWQQALDPIVDDAVELLDEALFEEEAMRAVIDQLEALPNDAPLEHQKVALRYLVAIEEQLLAKIQHLELQQLALADETTTNQSYETQMQRFIATVLASFPAKIRSKLPTDWHAGYSLVMTHALNDPKAWQHHLKPLIQTCDTNCRTTGRYLFDPIRNGILICDPEGEVCSLGNAIIKQREDGTHYLASYESYHVLTGKRAGGQFSTVARLPYWNNKR